MGPAFVGVSFDFGGLNVDFTFVFECVRLDVALVEQTCVRFNRADVAEIEKNLVPEAGVQQVQHCVLDTADVEVDAAGMVRPHVGARAHPVLLVLDGTETFVVEWIDVAHLVPARASPLRHHVAVAAVGLHAVAEVEFDVHPVVEPVQRALRVGHRVIGVERARGEFISLGQLDRQH